MQDPTPPDSIWHPERPGLQVVWDATSLGYIQACPERYRLKQVEGWRPTESRIDLVFGHVVGGALERFYLGVIEGGLGHDAALDAALLWALQETWDYLADAPMLGRYFEVWRCNGDVPYRNERGNRAKCPFAHLTKPPFVGPAPTVCSCGSTTTGWSQWVAEQPPKDRLAILRAIVAYAEEMKQGILTPVSYGMRETSNGPVPKALLEEQFFVPFSRIHGVEYWLTGWFDKIACIGPERVLIADYKTTGHTLGPRYWDQYSPNTQIDTYNLVGSYVLPPELASLWKGVAVEAIQILAEGVRYGYREFLYDAAKARETDTLTAYTIAQAALYHEAGWYPRNPQSCRWCEFREICASPPDKREERLAARFERKRWNPLTRTAEPV